ncbi:MAG TPA: helix-turn-helix domain-containing protein [Gemmatimonadaceae bacterium]
MTAAGIGRARRCLGMTQAELARALGVGRVTVARWETDVMRPTQRSVASLLDLLHDLAAAPSGSADTRSRDDVAQRFALVALFGGRVRLPVRSWAELLDVAPDVLADVPVAPGRDGTPLASGTDVGTGLEERLRGRAVQADSAAGERRLAQEIVTIAERWRS